MKFDKETGILQAKTIEISPLLMREEFVASEVCKHARVYSVNLPYISYRFRTLGFVLILFFKGSTLRRLDLMMELFEGEDSKEAEIFEEGDEVKRKRMHDAWLFRQGIRKDEDYQWGTVTSYHDRQINSSFITIAYQH